MKDIWEKRFSSSKFDRRKSSTQKGEEIFFPSSAPLSFFLSGQLHPRLREGGTPRCAQDSTLFPLLRFSLSASDQIYGTRKAIFAPATPVGGGGGIQSRFCPRRRRPFHRAAATDREEENILNCTPVAAFSCSLGLSRENKKLRRQKKKRIAKESTQGGGRGL